MAKYNLIPKPKKIIPGEGMFEIHPETRIQAVPAATAAAQTFARWLQRGTGFNIPIDIILTNPPPGKNLIFFTLADSDGGGSPESYTLKIVSDGVEINAPELPGLYNGLQTFRQLLPKALEQPHPKGENTWEVSSVTIQDQPRFSWRGLHLDVGRHMYPITFIKKYLDLMALHKLNVFHWHLTEDQGWRIEIKRYPRLTETGAWRIATPLPSNRSQLDGKPYGGFYTQDEVREVVAYAQSLGITVVPEIEMPGHAVAALASYPEFGCVGSGYSVRTTWGIAEDVYCAGNDAVFTFLENVLKEVFDLFPSEFIHIGGDECPKVRWKTCPRCQTRIRQEGLADEHALQSYFIRRIEAFLNTNGRRLIGWDEILEGGLAPNAAVMSWRGIEGGIQAAMAGHDVVMTPTSHCYFDYYQSRNTEKEPPAIGGYLPLEKVYSFNPTEGLPANKHQHVLGGQGNIWTEYMPTSEQVEYMAYPRTTALAEALWVEPSHKNYEDFLSRLQGHLQRLGEIGVNYRE